MDKDDLNTNMCLGSQVFTVLVYSLSSVHRIHTIFFPFPHLSSSVGLNVQRIKEPCVLIKAYSMVFSVSPWPKWEMYFQVTGVRLIKAYYCLCCRDPPATGPNPFGVLNHCFKRVNSIVFQCCWGAVTVPPRLEHELNELRHQTILTTSLWGCQTCLHVECIITQFLLSFEEAIEDVFLKMISLTASVVV